MKLKRVIYAYVIVIAIFLLKSELSIYRFKSPLIKGESIDFEEIRNEHIKLEGIDQVDVNLDLYRYYNGNALLNEEKIREDIDFLIERGWGSYGAYMAFGGDEVFNKAREDLLLDLNVSKLSVNVFERNLRGKLGFIEDGHFLINGRSLRNAETTYTVKDMEIENKFGKFYYDGLEIKNAKELNRFIKASIDENGEIIYRLFYKTGRDKHLLKEMYLEDGSLRDLVWTPVINTNLLGEIKPEFEDYDGIPLLKLKEFYSNGENDYDLITNSMKKMSTSKFSILDLRGNGGGDISLVSNLVYNYGKKNLNYSGDMLISMNLEKGDEENPKDSESKYALGVYFKYIMEAEKFDDNHYISRGNKKLFPKKESLFILADGNSASASEHTIDTMRHFTRTMIVGIPTAGLMHGSTAYDIVLPNSRLKISYGNLYLQLENSYFKEYYGLEPDLWIEPEFALDRTLKLIENLR